MRSYHHILDCREQGFCNQGSSIGDNPIKDDRNMENGTCKNGPNHCRNVIASKGTENLKRVTAGEEPLRLDSLIVSHSEKEQ